MLIGEWGSDAFLHYICKQVQEFTSGISSKMIVKPDFYTGPDKTVSVEDPMVAGNPNNFATKCVETLYCNQAIRSTFVLHH
eukprot:15355613-Ditylum_brightwellii.AAC.2